MPIGGASAAPAANASFADAANCSPCAHLYETGGLRRAHIRGHENVLKRLLAHVATRWVLEANARARRFDEAAGWRTDGAKKVERWEDCEAVEVRYACALS